MKDDFKNSGVYLSMRYGNSNRAKWQFDEYRKWQLETGRLCLKCNEDRNMFGGCGCNGYRTDGKTE